MHQKKLESLLALGFQCRLGCSEASDGHAKGRARDVVQTRLLAELDRSRIAFFVSRFILLVSPPSSI